MPLKFSRRQNACLKRLSQTIAPHVQPVSHMAGDVAAERAVGADNFRENGGNIREFRSRSRQSEPKLVVLANLKIRIAIKATRSRKAGTPDRNSRCREEITVQQKATVRI